MAFPFGSVKFGAYLAWAASQGCICECGYGGPHGSSCTKITAPSGKSVTVVGVQQTEALLSYSIRYYDRRLGLTSPFQRIDGEG